MPREKYLSLEEPDNAAGLFIHSRNLRQAGVLTIQRYTLDTSAQNITEEDKSEDAVRWWDNVDTSPRGNQK